MCGAKRRLLQRESSSEKGLLELPSREGLHQSINSIIHRGAAQFRMMTVNNLSMPCESSSRLEVGRCEGWKLDLGSIQPCKQKRRKTRRARALRVLQPVT